MLLLFSKCFLETKIMSFSLQGTWFLKIYFQNNSQKLLFSYYIINISYWLIFFFFFFSKLQLQMIIPAFSPTPFLFWVFLFFSFGFYFYVFMFFFSFFLCCSSQSCTLIFQIMKVNIIKLTICMLNLILRAGCKK